MDWEKIALEVRGSEGSGFVSVFTFKDSKNHLLPHLGMNWLRPVCSFCVSGSPFHVRSPSFPLAIADGRATQQQSTYNKWNRQFRPVSVGHTYGIYLGLSRKCSTHHISCRLFRLSFDFQNVLSSRTHIDKDLLKAPYFCSSDFLKFSLMCFTRSYVLPRLLFPFFFPHHDAKYVLVLLWLRSEISPSNSVPTNEERVSAWLSAQLHVAIFDHPTIAQWAKGTKSLGDLVRQLVCTECDGLATRCFFFVLLFWGWGCRSDM